MEGLCTIHPATCTKDSSSSARNMVKGRTLLPTETSTPASGVRIVSRVLASSSTFPTASRKSLSTLTLGISGLTNYVVPLLVETVMSCVLADTKGIGKQT